MTLDGGTSYFTKVTINTFTVVSWTGVSLAFLFLLFRVSVRLHSLKRLFWDDWCVVLAWLFALGTVVIWQARHQVLVEGYKFLEGKEPLTLQLVSETEQVKKTEAVGFVFYFSSLWSVSQDLSLLL